MTICFAELEHSSFEMERYRTQEIVREKAIAPNHENSQVKTVPAKPPRISVVAKFFSEIPKIANRTITAIKETWGSLKQRATVLWSYRTACNDSIKSLELAFKSGNINETLTQLKNFCELRGKQIKFLDEEDPASAIAFEKNFHQSLKHFLKPSVSELKAILIQLPELHRMERNSQILREEAIFIRSMITMLIKYAESPSSKLIPANRTSN